MNKTSMIRNQTFDEERALYGIRDLLVEDSSFDGPADGESAFKECSNIQTQRCFFNLRYPFWHEQLEGRYPSCGRTDRFGKGRRDSAKTD